MKPQNFTSVFALCASLLLSLPAAAQTVGSMSAADFKSSLGMNVHINYNDGAYANLTSVVKDLNYIGIMNVRTAGGGAAVPVSSYITLAKQGVKFNFVAPTAANLPTLMTFVDTVASAVPGSITSIEGFNEVNNWPVTYKGVSGVTGALQAQADLYKAVRSDPLLTNVPVYDLTGATGTANLAGRADFANGHPYNRNALQPGSFIAKGFTDYTGKAASAKKVITEFGNFSLPQGWPAGKPYWSAYTYLGVDERTQAKIILNGYFEAALNGVSRSYAYELLDEKKDAQNNQPGFHFGVFNYDHTPKQAAVVLHNLTTILASNNMGSKKSAIDYRFSTLPSTVRVLSMKQSNGSTILAIWNTVEFWAWNSTQSVPVATASVAAKLYLDPRTMTIQTFYIAPGTASPLPDIQVFDPMISASAIARVNNQTGIPLSIPDHPILVVITPAT